MKPLPKRSGTPQAVPTHEEKVIEMTTEMDRTSKRSFWTVKKSALLAGVVVAALIAFPVYQNLADGGAVSLPAERVTTGAVASAPFGEFVPVNARLIPDETVFLDTVQGGRVITVHVEEGQMVSPGAALVTLKNVDLELQVMSREAQYTDQLSNLAGAEINFDQNRLRYDRDLMDAQLQIDLTRTALQQRLPIEETGFAQAEIDRLQSELTHQEQTFELIGNARAKDQRNAARNLSQLRGSVDRMEDSLDLLRDTLGGLTLTAPIEGQVSALDVRLGEVVAGGGRVGQIDALGGFKARAVVDEFYLGRIAVGQTGTAEFDGGEVALTVSKVLPNITNRQFEIDLKFEGETPANLRRGQALRVRLSLSDVEPKLTVPNGAWFEDTDGSWIFVISPNGKTATRRSVTLGRRNPEQVEVLSGLSDGERVLTSSYDGLTDKTQINLTGTR